MAPSDPGPAPDRDGVPEPGAAAAPGHGEHDPAPPHGRSLLAPALDVEQVIYATVTLVSVLMVYDVTDTIQVVTGAAALVVGPLLALYAAHVFASGLSRHMREQRVLTAAEWREEAGHSLSLLVVALPPLALLVVGRLVGWEVSAVIRVIVLVGVASLGFWAGVAAWRAGLGRGRIAAAVVLGLLVGLLVLSVQLLLKPH